MLEYRDCLIFEQNGEFTVGTENNYEFNDCNLENFWLCDEFEAVKWNMEHGNKIIFVGLRGETECECVSYERYLKHLMRYKIEKDNSFVDEELIVPCVTFETINKAKEFIDWVWLYMTREKPEKICLEYDYKDVEAELHKMGCVIESFISITHPILCNSASTSL